MSLAYGCNAKAVTSFGGAIQVAVKFCHASEVYLDPNFGHDLIHLRMQYFVRFEEKSLERPKFG